MTVLESAVTVLPLRQKKNEIQSQKKKKGKTDDTLTWSLLLEVDLRE